MNVGVGDEIGGGAVIESIEENLETGKKEMWVARPSGEPLARVTEIHGMNIKVEYFTSPKWKDVVSREFDTIRESFIWIDEMFNGEP